MHEERCTACPRMCMARRKDRVGFCGTTEKIKIARVGLHLWEEPCLSYGKGSGTVFFSGCNLRCVYCQNHEISQEGQGREITEELLEREILSLQEQGASNINLVTPSHYTEAIGNVLTSVKPKLQIPVVYNSSGYDSVESLKKLEGLIDIYLPDLKYMSSEISRKYSGAEDYFEVATRAIEEMVRQCGYYQEDEVGRMKTGVLIRHMVLPGNYRDSMNVLDWIAETYHAEKMAISLMSQYFPAHRAAAFREINRKLTSFEYKKVVEHARMLGFEHGFMQQRDSASEEYVPDFDY